MGCGASIVDGSGPRRGWARVRALGHSEASTTGQQEQGQQQGQEAESSSSSSAGRRRAGSKVAPEPKEQEEEAAAAAAPPLPPMPGSPSFRYYCQKKTAAVDKLVADSDGAARIRATTRQVSSRRNEVAAATDAHESSQVSEPKEEPKEGTTRWPKFKGLSIVTTAWHNLFSRHTRKPSLPPAVESHHPPAATAAA